MGILYQASDPMVWAIWLFVVFALMAFNEFGRTSVWGGVALFVVAPIVFTIFVWPTLRARQRVWHGKLVQLGENVFCAGGLRGIHGVAIREMAWCRWPRASFV